MERERFWSLATLLAFVLFWLGGLLIGTMGLLAMSPMFFFVAAVVAAVGALAGLTSGGLAVHIWLVTRRFPPWLAVIGLLLFVVPLVLYYVADVIMSESVVIGP